MTNRRRPAIATRSWAIASLLLPGLSTTTILARAQTVDTETSTPLQTSTADAGAPADIVISSGGTISIDGVSDTVGVTIDSDNTLTNDGTIEITNADDVTGVLISPGLTSSISGGGTISLTDDFERTDTDGDGDLDGPFATGSNRTGILLQPGGALDGSINLASGAVIDVDGNDSAGISLQSLVNGDFESQALVTATGSNSVAIDIAEGITGDVVISGDVGGFGEGTEAFVLGDDVDGNLTLQSTIISTGFINTTITNFVAPDFLTDETPPLEERIDAEDITTGGAAVTINGDVANGVLINGAVTASIRASQFGDTFNDEDVNRPAASITSVGSAPALLIAPNADATDNLILGPTIETVRDGGTGDVITTFNLDEGLINRGAVVANGLNSGFSATAIDIRGGTGGIQTEITGGIFNTGLIDADAFDADSTGIRLGGGVITPANGLSAGGLFNEGVIDVDLATTGGVFEAVAIDIEDGASLPNLTNFGLISSSASFGLDSSAIAIRDTSGTLQTITNSGGIGAFFIPTSMQTLEEIADRAGVSVAIDLSGHGVGQDVTLIQQELTEVIDTNSDGFIDGADVSIPSIFGDILFGAGDDTINVTAGVIASDIDYGTGDAILSLSNAASVTGNVTFADGIHAIDVSGTDTLLFGGLDFTNSNASLAINGGSTVSSALTTSASTLDISVDSSTLFFAAGTSADLASLTVAGADNVIGFGVDADLLTADPFVTVATPVTLGDATTIDINVLDISTTGFTQTLLAAPDLAIANLPDGDIEVSSFIYDGAVALNQGAVDTLDLTVTLKTPDELGLDVNQAAAYPVILGQLDANDTLGAQFATITTEEDFFDAVNEILPQRSSASTRFLQSQANASFGALRDRLDLIRQSGYGRGAWVRETVTFLDIDVDEEAGITGYDGTGVGVAFGIDFSLLGFDAAGIMGTAATGSFQETLGGTDPTITTNFGVGLYLEKAFGPLVIDLVGQASRVRFLSDRTVTFGSIESAVDADWNGWSQSASARASIELTKGWFFIRPQASVNFFALQQDAYSENNADGLAFEFGENNSSLLTADGQITLGGAFTRRGRRIVTPEIEQEFGTYFVPQISIGGRTTLNQNPFSVDTRFVGSDNSFTLTSQEVFSEAVTGGLSLALRTRGFAARLGYNGELSSEGLVHTAGLSVRFNF